MPVIWSYCIYLFIIIHLAAIFVDFFPSPLYDGTNRRRYPGGTHALSTTPPVSPHFPQSMKIACSCASPDLSEPVCDFLFGADKSLPLVVDNVLVIELHGLHKARLKTYANTEHVDLFGTSR